jgi:hypothetical protein
VREVAHTPMVSGLEAILSRFRRNPREVS